MPEGVPEHVGVFAISVAAAMVETGEQNLRLYERRGLITPERSPGGTRRYSRADITRLRRIVALIRDDGLNLAGVAMVLDLQDRLDAHEAPQGSSRPDGTEHRTTDGLETNRAPVTEVTGARALPHLDSNQKPFD